MLMKLEKNKDSVAYWIAHISASWERTKENAVEGFIETGRRIIASKQRIPRGEFLLMIEKQLPFKRRTAQRLMRIALFGEEEGARFSKATHVSLLPPSWGTLYELTKLDDDEFSFLVKNKIVRPDMERRDIAHALKGERRARNEKHLAKVQMAWPTKRYGVIYADPEWQFKFRSERGKTNSSADNHYDTSPLDEIKRRNVPSISAPDCALFLWATVPMLTQCLDVMKAWGFEYKSSCTWIKNKAGTGYWFRNQHELLLLGTIGAPPAPAPGQQWSSVIEHPVGKHSAKPSKFYEMIEAYFPTLPKIELNARSRRKGWDAWGNEVPELEAAE